MAKRAPTSKTTISFAEKDPDPPDFSVREAPPAKKIKPKQQTLLFVGGPHPGESDKDPVEFKLEAACISLPAQPEPDPNVRNPWPWTEPRYAYLGALPVKSADPRNRPARYECKACQRQVTAYFSSTDSLKKHQTKVHRLPAHVWDALRKPAHSVKPSSQETDPPSVSQRRRRVSSDKVSVCSSSRMSSAMSQMSSTISRGRGPLDSFIRGEPTSQEANELFFDFMVSQLMPFRCLDSESLSKFFKYVLPEGTLWSRKQAAAHLSVKAKSEINRLTTHLSTLEWVSLTADIWSGPNCR